MRFLGTIPTALRAEPLSKGAFWGRAPRKPPLAKGVASPKAMTGDCPASRPTGAHFSSGPSRTPAPTRAPRKPPLLKGGGPRRQAWRGDSFAAHRVTAPGQGRQGQSPCPTGSPDYWSSCSTPWGTWLAWAAPSQAPYPSLSRTRESSLTSLLRLSPRDPPLRGWARAGAPPCCPRLCSGYAAITVLLTAAAAARPGEPGWPGPAWPGRTGSGCCSWCRPSSRRPRRCRGWWTRRPGCSPPSRSGC